MSLSLTPKEEIFVAEYFKTGKKQMSAIIAGYSKTSAAATATKLLKKTKIQQAIEEIRGQVKTRALISVDEVINGLKEIANDDSTSKRDRVSAFNSLGRYLGIFIDKSVDITIEALEAYARKTGIESEELKAEIADMKAQMKGPKLVKSA